MRQLAIVLLAVSLQANAQQAQPLNTFAPQLWTNTKGLVSADNLLPLLLGAAATGTATIFDERTQNYFGPERRAAWIGNSGEVIGHPALIGGTAGILLLTSCRTTNDRFKAMSFDLSQGFVIDALITTGLKYSTQRMRPDESNNRSFPSGHASSSTMAATVLAHYYPKTAIPAYLVAGFVGFSRIEKNKHWLSDVVGGATQGYIVGSTVTRHKTPFKVGRLQWTPMVSRTGFGALASIRLQ
jgi:membrane-associated phospholipid phosphatase